VIAGDLEFTASDIECCTLELEHQAQNWKLAESIHSGGFSFSGIPVPVGPPGTTVGMTFDTSVTTTSRNDWESRGKDGQEQVIDNRLCFKFKLSLRLRPHCWHSGWHNVCQ
jgi:hypothetical protein